MPSRPLALSRRRFLASGLALGLGAACACHFPSALLAATPSADNAARADNATRDRRIRQGFAGIVAGAQAWLKEAVGPREAAAVAAACPARLEALLPGVPYIGPANRNQESLEDAVWLAALTLAMRTRGLPEAMAGRLFYDLCAEEMRERLAKPESAAALAAEGVSLFTPHGREDLRAWTTATQARKYPADWVGRAVFGDGEAFDLGYDYAECGAVKYFQACGVGKVAPYFCLNDFTTSRAMGTGLAREHTLGQGDALCDFRYRQGRPVTQSWETEIARIEGRKG